MASCSAACLSAAEEQLLSAAQKIEDELDTEIHALSGLEVESLEEARRKRLVQMKRKTQQEQQWRKLGHGEQTEIFSDKEFFQSLKGEERAVCLFYRESLPCKALDQCMHILARSHNETKFIKIHAERSPYLVEKLKIWMLPTLAILRGGKVVDYIVGLGGFSEGYQISVEALTQRLRQGNAIFERSRRSCLPQDSIRISHPLKDSDSD